MIRWVWALIDRPLASLETSTAFWARVTGSGQTTAWGERDEFVTLTPDVGDAYVIVQGVDVGMGAHPDLGTDDLAADLERARVLGAEITADHPGLTVLRSPAGQPFCLASLDTPKRLPAVAVAPNGATSRLDQICLDVGPSDLAGELEFWSELTGWESLPGKLPEFDVLRPPAGMPIRLLMQRLDEDRKPSAHLDFSCSDVRAVRAWHEANGAHLKLEMPGWTVMTDPVSGIYCLTARDPETGRLVG